MQLLRQAKKQISIYKYQRIARSPDSKRVRVFIRLSCYEHTEALEAYLYEGYIYSYMGYVKKFGHQYKYKTYYFRYPVGAYGVYIVGQSL